MASLLGLPLILLDRTPPDWVNPTIAPTNTICDYIRRFTTKKAAESAEARRGGA